MRPQLVICLGATAAQSLLGAAFRVSTGRGELLNPPTGSSCRPQVLATVHPRTPSFDKAEGG